MREGAEFAIVAMLGQRLQRERTGWRDAKALVLCVARNGPWEPAASLADALGVGPDAQEAIYHEAYDDQPLRPAPEPRAAAPTPARFPSPTEQPRHITDHRWRTA